MTTEKQSELEVELARQEHKAEVERKRAQRTAELRAELLKGK